MVIAAGWGAAEATVFFVVPDVQVGWVALRRPRLAVATWLAAVVGGVVGAAAVHQAVLAGWNPDEVFRSLPGTQAGDLERVRVAVERDPLRAFIAGAMSGVPLKIYVAEAARQGLPLRRTLGLVVINRAPRIGLFGLSLAAAGAAVRLRWQPNGRQAAAVYGLGWVAFYSWYWILRAERPEGSVEET
jgi:hypothetical protein